MNIDALKTAWYDSVTQPASSADLDRVARDTRAHARRYRRTARLRAVYGTAAFALALGMLATLMLVPEGWPGMRIAMAVWSASAIACVIGLWRIRAERRIDANEPLAAYLRACLQQIQREIAYQRALRWLWWLPFGIGLLAAGMGRVSATPDLSWLFALVAAGFWAWGFIHGPRHWPQRLQPEAHVLQKLLDAMNVHTQPTSLPGAAA